MLYRNKKDGKQTKIRVFLRSDPYAYVQFWPMDGSRSQMDLVVNDGYLFRSLPVAVPFDALLDAPMKDVLASIGRAFPFQYFDIDQRAYGETRSLIAEIRAALPGLAYADDGAFDQDGKPIYIASLAPQLAPAGLNCSGFAKWVVDGILRPFTGARLAVPPLKLPSGVRGSSFTLPYETLRDPFFGLDWTRNLAIAAASALRPGSQARIEELEVRSSPLSSVNMRSSGQRWIRPYPPYLKDAGFGVEGLRALLYHLAVSEPGWLYLASVNKELGNSPRMRQHFHVAVLIPYFDEKGAFRTDVFESAAETSLAAFIGRYPGHHINLVRIPVERGFDP